MKTIFILAVIAVTSITQTSIAATGRIDLSLREGDILCSDTTMLIRSFQFRDKPRLEHEVFTAKLSTAKACYRALFRVLDTLPNQTTETYSSQVSTETGTRQRGNCHGPHGCWDEEYTYSSETISFDLSGIIFRSEANDQYKQP